MSLLEKYAVINDLGEFKLQRIDDEAEQLDENCQYILHYQKRDTGFSNKLWEFKLYDTDGKPKEIKKRGWCAAALFHTESAWNPARAFVDITDPKGTKEMVVFWRVSPELVFNVNR